MKLLICYDGSPDSRAALQLAGRLFSGAAAVVLTIWEGFSEVVARSRAGLIASALDFEAIDRSAEQAARECADHGCGLARAEGLKVQPRVVPRGWPVWESILDQADDVDADVVVLGSRGLSGTRSLLLGSVSRAVLEHADRPVLIVPRQGVATARTAARPERGGA